MKFIDAQELSKHSTTFYAPNKSELDSIEEGSIVKVCNGFERFWTKVLVIKNDNIIAVIDNILVDAKEYDFGDTIKFEKRHIYSIWQEK